MDDFVEMDEIGRLENEIKELMLEMRHLLYLKSSGKDVDDEKIDRIRKRIVDLRFTLKQAEGKVDKDDRYKDNKRK